MMFALGIVLFALAILVSVALHECGHMWVARATGMKVRRYFVGFGPTLWSTHRPNKIGSTEYGVKAIPLGGFCDIAGMTSVEELEPGDERYAMFRQKTWKRVAVLFAGPAMNFVIGLVILYAIAISWGLPNLHPSTAAVVGQTACVAPQVTKDVKDGEDPFGPCPQPGPGPAALAGIQAGDTIVKVGDADVATFADMAAAIRTTTGPVAIVYERDGQRFTTTACGTRASPKATFPAPSRSPATWPSNSANRSPRSPPRWVPWCTRSAAANATRKPRFPWWARPSSAATPSTTACGWRSGSSWPSSTSCWAR